MRDRFSKPQSNKEYKKRRLNSLKEVSKYKNVKNIKQLKTVDVFVMKKQKISIIDFLLEKIYKLKGE